MPRTNTVFSQLLKRIPKSKFQRHVTQFNSDKRVRKFFTWDHFSLLLFGQLSQAKSLRDLIQKTESQQSHLRNIGIHSVSRSAFSEANKTRSTAVFYSVFFDLINTLNHRQNFSKLKQAVMLMDATVVTLCQQHYQWAKFRDKKAGIKIHTVYDPNLDAPIFFEVSHAKVSDSKGVAHWSIMEYAMYVFDRAYNGSDYLRKIIDNNAFFVGRMKKNMPYKVLKEHAPKGEGVIRDEYIEVTFKTKTSLKGITLRRIEYTRPNNSKILVFFSNDLDRSALEIAELYKRRWQIELFFKWIKQNLKVKRFYGTNENAVILQVLVAMISYLLLRLLQESGTSRCSLLHMMQRLSLGLFQRRRIEELLMSKPEKAPKAEIP